VHHGSARHRPPHLSRHQRHQLLGRHRASPSDPPAPLRHLTPHPPFPATKSLPPPSHSPIPPTMAIASDSNAGAQPREDPSLLLITSFSLALSILTLATPTLGFVPLHHPPPHSDLYTRRLPPPSIMWPLPRRPTRLNSTTSSVISPLPSSRSGLSRSVPSGAPPPPPASGRRRTLVWFRADLRLHDQAVHTAARALSSLFPVFVFSSRDFDKSPLGFDRTGPYRAKFLLDSVVDLRRGPGDARG
jgi:hypothetical protein